MQSGCGAVAAPARADLPNHRHQVARGRSGTAVQSLLSQISSGPEIIKVRCCGPERMFQAVSTGK
eukprot:11133981-Alexandrium_andersonii.AAC.1